MIGRASRLRRRHRPVELRREQGHAPLCPHRKRRSSTVACFTLGVALVLAGLGISIRQQAERAAYEALGSSFVVTDPQDGSRQAARGDTTPDWESLRAQNEEIVAWVTVEGIDLSLPVVAPRDADMEYYLAHDFWRNDSFEGTPFLDHRSDANGPHRLTYGHHLTAGGQFSDLQHAWVQEEFDRLGTCHWHTPQMGETRLVPLCAAKVDLWCATIQRFAFDDSGDLRTWLDALYDRCSACNPQARRVIAKARSAVTLVTCSSDIGNQDWRTVTTFVEI